MVYPCPNKGARYRPGLVERGGRSMFPYLADPNTGRELYESDDIVRYLFEMYGAGRRPASLSLGILTDVNSSLASAARVRGSRARPSRAPGQPLELYSFEASPHCRIVRDALCDLELAYLLRNVGRGSPSRAAFVERSGRMEVPYLVDPNANRALFDSADIVRYLDDTYAA